MTGDDGHESRGVLGTLRRLGDHLIGLAENRFALIGVEAEEEKWRLADLLVRAVTVAVLALGAVGTFTALVVFLVPLPPAGTLAILCVLYAGGAWLGVAGLRRRLRESPRPFQRTMEEFQKDRAWLQRRS
ncbi:MAG: phage holin family protein [Limisphaerales bacterium]